MSHTPLKLSRSATGRPEESLRSPTVVVPKQSTKTLSALAHTCDDAEIAPRFDQAVFQSLMVPFSVIMGDELASSPSQ